MNGNLADSAGSTMFNPYADNTLNDSAYYNNGGMSRHPEGFFQRQPVRSFFETRARKS